MIYVLGSVIAVGITAVLWALIHSHMDYVHTLEQENAELQWEALRRSIGRDI